MNSILVVCTGNICRSPVGEAVLQHLLPPHISVTSAGTHALAGHPAVPETLEFVKRSIGTKHQHCAQQLSRAHAESSDLIIAMTSEHRSWIARNAPRAVRRTFTLKEFDLLLQEQPSAPPFKSLKDLALSASRLRPRLLGETINLDIADPYGGPPDGYESSFSEVHQSSRRVAEAITQRLQSA